VFWIHRVLDPSCSGSIVFWIHRSQRQPAPRKTPHAAANCLPTPLQFIAVSVAWFIQRVISCVHTSTRGAEMLLRGLHQFTEKQGIDVPTFLDPGNFMFQVACSAVAGVGALWQIYNGARCCCGCCCCCLSGHLCEPSLTPTD
jgi:hypothetical protein